MAIPKCVAAARTLVEHFKKREVACKKLGVKKKQMGTKENISVEDVAHAARVLMPCCQGCKNREMANDCYPASPSSDPERETVPRSQD